MSFFFNPPPPPYACELTARGLILAPHTAGLVIKAVWGWAADVGTVGTGSVITMVGNISGSDRASMVVALSGSGGGCHMLTVALGWVAEEEWPDYPRHRDVVI